MGTLKQNLLAGRGIDRPHRIILAVAAAEADQLAVRRPIRTVNHVETDRHRKDLLPRGHVPNLHFAHLGRHSARHRQTPAIGRKSHRFDPVRLANQPAHDAGALGIDQQHLVETGHRQQLAVGRKIDRGDHRRPRVGGRMLLVVLRSGKGGRVVLRPLGDPGLDQFDVRRGQRRPVLGHGGFAVDRRDLREQVTVIRLFRHDRRVARLAARQQLGEVGHDIFAAGLGRLVAALALGLKDRAHLLVIADRAGPAGLGIRRTSNHRGAQKNQSSRLSRSSNFIFGTLKSCTLSAHARGTARRWGKIGMQCPLRPGKRQE